MPFITQGPEGEQAPYGVNKTNIKYLLIVLILAVIVGGGTLGYQYWWLPKQEAPPLILIPTPSPTDETAELIPSEVEGWKTYRNEEYEYEVKYPEDWRIANFIMEWEAETAAHPYYTPRIEDWVMITNLSAEEEKEYLEALEGYIGIGSPLNYIKNADGRAIMVYPVTIPYENLKNPEPDVGWKNFEFREEETETGLKVIRLRAEITWEMDRDYEWAFVPYLGDKTLWQGKVTYIRLEIVRNEGNYEKEVFDKILSTFRFLDENLENRNQQKDFREDISACVSVSNYSYELYVTFVPTINSDEAQNILTEVGAYDIKPTGANHVYYFYLPDGEICSRINQLKMSDKVIKVDAVPWMPTGPSP